MQLTLASLLSLVALASATATVTPLVCPRGTTKGTQVNTHVFNATVSDVKDIIGQFQTSDWQGLTQVAQSGPENTRGSTRSVSYGPFVLVEELLAFKSSTQHQTQDFFLNNGPIAVSQDYSITNYQEHLALSVVTANKKAPKSEIDWTVDFCFTGDASNSANVAALFDGAHSGAFANIESILAEN